MNRITTKDAAGNPNGFLLPIWHVDEGPPIDQVYLTVVVPGAVKGPHLHMKRHGLFCCIRGSVRVVMRDPTGRYISVDLGERSGFPRIEVPAGTPAAIYNTGDCEAYLLNMPSPPWRSDDQDEWPVDNWEYECAA